MSGAEPFLLPMVAVAGALADGLFAYGPAPGMEFLPQFLAMAAWIGLAFLAILLAPFSALLRRLRRAKNTPALAPPIEEKTPSPAQPAGEDKHKEA
jgi:hypothetical protein